MRIEVPDHFVAVTAVPHMAPEPPPQLRVRIVRPEGHQSSFTVDDAIAAHVHGLDLDVWPLVELGPLTVEHYVLDHLIPAALGLLGHTVLHASGAASNGRGIVFAGPSGAGKSTLALWLASQGWSWLGDDAIRLTPIAEEPGHLHMWPSYPGARIHADGHEGIFSALQSAGPVNDGGTKQRLTVASDRVAEDPAGAVLLVSVDPDPGGPALEPLTLAETAHVIAQQSFMPATDNRLAAVDRLDRALAVAPDIAGLRLRHLRTAETLTTVESMLIDALDRHDPTSRSG